MAHKVLVIEDEKHIRKIVSDYLKAQGYEILEAQNGKDGLEKFEGEEVDLVVLDVMMPELDGWTVCRRIRKKSDVPIIMLTARTEEDDELMGFELRADDYVKKPFSPNILVARVRALLERKSASDSQELCLERFELGGISLDRLSREVSLDGNNIDLAPKEFDMLSYLMENKNVVFSREKILQEVWGYDFIGENRTVDNHIKKLRKALGEKSYLIRTVFGVGYKFEVKI